MNSPQSPHHGFESPPISVERTALPVNPYDVTGVTTAIHDALFGEQQRKKAEDEAIAAVGAGI